MKLSIKGKVTPEPKDTAFFPDNITTVLFNKPDDFDGEIELKYIKISFVEGGFKIDADGWRDINKSHNYHDLLTAILTSLDRTSSSSSDTSLPLTITLTIPPKSDTKDTKKENK